MTLKKLIIFGIVIRLILAPFFKHVDLLSLADWGTRFWQYGPSDFYFNNVWSLSWPTQPPYFMLILAAMRKLYETVLWLLLTVHTYIRIYPSIVIRLFADYGYMMTLKLPAILADVGVGVVIYKMTESRSIKWARIAASLYIFNPVTIYLSALWGQNESVIVFLAMLSFVFLEKRKLWLAAILFFVAFYTKMTILIWIPVFLFSVLVKRFSFSRILLSVTAVFVLFYLSSMIFVKNQTVFKFTEDLFNQKILLGSKGTERLAMSAFNFWSMLYGFNEQTADTRLLGMTGKNLGVLLAAICNLAVLVWYLKDPTVQRLLYSLFIGGFASVLFLTTMHERYYFLPFSALIVVYSFNKKVLNCVLTCSFILLANLHFSWWLNHIQWVYFLFKSYDQLLIRILSLANILLFLQVVRFASQEKKELLI